MKKLKSLNGFEPISNEGLNSVRGGVTLNTVTVIAHLQKMQMQEQMQANETTVSDDGDDGIRND